MPLLFSAFIVLTLSGWSVVPAAISYFSNEENDQAKITVIISPSATPTPSPTPSPEDVSEPTTTPTPAPLPKAQVKTTTTINGTTTESSPEDCDFEYHFNTSGEDSDAIDIKHECEQKVTGSTGKANIDNDVTIKANTGGNKSDGDNEDVTTGDVKVDISIKNEVE
jgi:hypothetical protein